MDVNEISKWAKKLIETHKNPIKKLELCGNKFFLPTGSDYEVELVKKSLDALTVAVNSERVDRRCARSVANWLPEQKLAEVTQIHGFLNNLGFANKTGKFLYPEEALFLLEMNRLELFWNDVPLSIQQAYEIILNNSECNVTKYMAYKKLTLQGFRLFRTLKQESVGEPVAKKPRVSENPESFSNTTEKNIKPKTEESEMIDKIFEKLQESGPKKLVPSQTQIVREENFKIFSPENSSRTSPYYNLEVCVEKHMDSSLSFVDEQIPTVINYADSAFVGYFCFGRVDLPNLT